MNVWDLYVLAFYFSVTSMTTVGYGDMSGSNSLERIFCIVLMVIGVVVFTFISGSLSSVLSNFDSTNASLQEQMLFLNRLSS
jgi:hypothetical protein